MMELDVLLILKGLLLQLCDGLLQVPLDLISHATSGLDFLVS